MPDFLEEVRAAYAEQPQRPPPTEGKAGPGDDTPYGLAALHGECDALANTLEGSRNSTLNVATVKLAGHVAAGNLTEQTTRDALYDAARLAGLDHDETLKTIASGWRKGITEPHYAPERRDEFTASTPGNGGNGRGRRVRITWASTIQPKAVKWAWLPSVGNGRIPAGALSLSAGREGTGKSSFGIWLTAQITRGTLPGEWVGVPRKALYLAVEDSWEHTLVPRMMAADADLSLVGRLDVVTDDDNEITMSLPDDLAELERIILEESIALVTLDPLMSVMGDNIDTHRNREVRQALDPLARLADKTGAIIHGIAHFNKSSGKDAASLISGSGAFKDVPRALFGFARDDNGRVMTQVKNSLGRDDLPSLEYKIESVDVPLLGPLTTEVGRFGFVGETDRSVSDVLSDAASDDAGSPKERDFVASWLKDYLGERGGEASSSDIKQAAKDADIGAGALRSGFKRAGLSYVRRGMPSKTHWSLDPNADEELQS